MTRPTEITLYIDDIDAEDLREAMAEAKRNLRREEGQRDHVTSSGGMVLPICKDGHRIEDLVSFWDGAPRITAVREAFKDSRVYEVTFDCQCYWVDLDCPLKDRWENREIIGSYATVTVRRGSEPLAAGLANAKQCPESAGEKTLAAFGVLLSALEDQMDGDGYGTPHVLVPVIEAARAYLNFDLGRIDGGTADRELCAIASRVGWDLDRDEWDRDQGEAPKVPAGWDKVGTFDSAELAGLQEQLRKFSPPQENEDGGGLMA